MCVECNVFFAGATYLMITEAGGCCPAPTPPRQIGAYFVNIDSNYQKTPK